MDTKLENEFYENTSHAIMKANAVIAAIKALIAARNNQVSWGDVNAMAKVNTDLGEICKKLKA